MASSGTAIGLGKHFSRSSMLCCCAHTRIINNTFHAIHAKNRAIPQCISTILVSSDISSVSFSAPAIMVDTRIMPNIGIKVDTMYESRTVRFDVRGRCWEARNLAAVTVNRIVKLVPIRSEYDRVKNAVKLRVVIKPNSPNQRWVRHVIFSFNFIWNTFFFLDLFRKFLGVECLWGLIEERRHVSAKLEGSFRYVNLMKVVDG